MHKEQGKKKKHFCLRRIRDGLMEMLVFVLDLDKGEGFRWAQMERNSRPEPRISSNFQKMLTSHGNRISYDFTDKRLNY